MGALWQGFVWARCGEASRAISTLSGAEGPNSDLENWRFVVLTEARLGQQLDGSVEEEMAHRPDWVDRELREQYLLYLAENAPQSFWAQYQAFDGVEPVPPTVEDAAWKLAQNQPDVRLRRQVAVAMLERSPVQASLNQVVEALRQADGEIPWRLYFGADQLLRRAENLLDAGIPAGALASLEEVPDAHRSAQWSVARSRALTMDRRGAEAWNAVAAVIGNSERERLDIAWAKAEAALDAAKVRRGRTNLGSAERAQMRQRGRHQLDWIAASARDTDEQARALRRKVADLTDDDSEADVVSLALSLAQVDPDDRTAERWLWNRGWQAYQKRNWTQALGIWRQLLDIYPQGRQSDRATYWSGKAHEKLGNRARAVELWTDLAAAPVDHYYSRRARERLASPPVSLGRRFALEREALSANLATAAWFERAGLPELAERELTRVDEALSSDQARTLMAKLLAGKGDRRTSIQYIWRAHKVLGTSQESLAPRSAHLLYYPGEHEQTVRRQAVRAGLEPELVWAMIRQESAFDIRAKSRAGARGLMQVMPATGREQARKLGLRYSLNNLYDPDYNVRLGTTYFRRVMDMFDGHLELSLAGYNSGPYRLRKWVTQAGDRLELDSFIEELPFEETKTYVRRIVQFKSSYELLYGESVAAATASSG